jgi:glutathione reductase (NADPH)
MVTFDYDLFVIGGGSGGVRAARVAASTGARVALAEDSRMGGTCVIRGCVPKKLMVFASTYREDFADARAFGWDLSPGDFDWSRFSGQLNAELDRLEAVYRKLLQGSNVEIFGLRARLVDPHTVALSDGRQMRAKHILIATGGRPVRPDIAHADLGMVSDDIFAMQRLPGSMLIVGGGYIACEFAGVLNGLGVGVTQFYRGAQILRGFDDEARALIADGMRDRGVALHLGTDIVAMTPAEGGALRVTGTDGSDRVYDAVLFATGRRPNTAGLGLENLGIDIGPGGEIVVDAYSQTTVPSVFAIGDVTDRVTLTPVAIREAMAFVETVFRGNPTPVDHDLVPSAVFTQPEFGTVGLSEEQARAREPVEIYATSFRPMQSAFAGRADRVLMKLVVSQATRRVLGCHIVAPQAGEMIQLAAIAIKMGATKEDFDRTVAVHPTMAEELVTMKSPVRMA